KEPEQAAVAQPEVQENNEVYLGRQELEALTMQEFLNELIGVNWEPPVGLSPDLVCNVAVVVDWQGGIRSIDIAQSSGVLIFDFSARTALQKISTRIIEQEITLPPWTKGKQFTIAFKQ